MAHVFELITGESRARKVGEFPSMAAASAALPQGAYTTFRTYRGNEVVLLERHFDRLEESLGLMGHTVALDRQAARRCIASARAEAGFPESRFRLTLAGPPPGKLFVGVEAFSAPPPSAYAKGVRCVTVYAHRNNPHAKSTEFIITAEAEKHLLPPDVNEGLMVAGDGTILEGLSSNFFALKGDTLHTEERRVLAGLTRALVLELASAAGLRLSLIGIPVGDLIQIDEAFITSVSREILPVCRIDDQTIGTGAPGPRTKALMAAFAEVATREAEPLD